MTQSQEAMHVLEALKATDYRHMFERYQVIHLHVLGYTQKNICAIVTRSNKTVSSYIHSYRKDGLKGLEMGKSPGAPRKLTENQEHELVQVVAYKTPHEVGFENHYNWTLSIISDFIKREWDQTYMLRGVSRLLEDLHKTYLCP